MANAGGCRRKGGISLTEDKVLFLLHNRGSLTPRRLATEFSAKFGIDLPADALHRAAFALSARNSKPRMPSNLGGKDTPPPLIKRPPKFPAYMQPSA